MSSATIDILSAVFCKTVKRVLETSTGKKIHFSNTIQRVPKISIRPEIGSFVQFSGDYNGLAVFNFSAGAAMEIYRNYMLVMGMPESEIVSHHTSDQVPDALGEITNHIMGQAMSVIEEKFDLRSYCGQPKALALNSAITLTIDSDYSENRRVVFTTSNHKFYMELAMEATEFISIKDLPV